MRFVAFLFECLFYIVLAANMRAETELAANMRAETELAAQTGFLRRIWKGVKSLFNKAPANVPAATPIPVGAVIDDAVPPRVDESLFTPYPLVRQTVRRPAEVTKEITRMNTIEYNRLRIYHPDYFEQELSRLTKENRINLQNRHKLLPAPDGVPEKIDEMSAEGIFRLQNEHGHYYQQQLALLDDAARNKVLTEAKAYKEKRQKALKESFPLPDDIISKVGEHIKF
jgi:hypothetical protein